MIWYPYTQMKTMEDPIQVTDAHGVILETTEGPLIDSISSWWSNDFGYAHPELTAAITGQAEHFSHVMLGGLTHAPVQKLADKLAEWLPGDLDYCFFSDSGSVAIEVALKMALQYYMNRGIKGRTTVLSLEHSYHGDTFQAMKAGDDEDYHFVLEAYGPDPDFIHIPAQLSALEEAFEKYHDRLNCFIAEPLLQGAGGLRMYDISLLERARQLCDRYDVLLIFDEVATGFGRTGHRFVSDVVLPDILVLGKALTGGYLGHAATVARKHVFDAFYDDDPDKALMHGPTFMGNPLAASVALKAIEIFDRDDYMAKVRRIEDVTRREMKGFADPRIREIRIMGACVCIEVYDEADLEGFASFARRRGVFNRPFLQYLYAMVPYVITEEQLITVLDTMKDWFRRGRTERPDGKRSERRGGIDCLADEIIAGRRLDRNEDLSWLTSCDLEALCGAADRIRRALTGDKVDLCTIINGKAGRCSEDCRFCAQSARHSSECETYAFLDAEAILKEAKANEAEGVDRFAVVTAGRALKGEEFEQALAAYRRLREETGLELCASMGLLSRDQLIRLKEAGITRYHENIETSRRNFPNICTTHTYDDKIQVIRTAQEIGLSVCSGGIIGMGETWEDRIDMALSLAQLGIRSIPINALMPIPGTPLEGLPRLSEDEIRRTVAIFRFIVPEADIRLAAGRALCADHGAVLFCSGASSTITGNMLTTTGTTIRSDREMLKELGRGV